MMYSFQDNFKSRNPKLYIQRYFALYADKQQFQLTDTVGDWLVIVFQ